MSDVGHLDPFATAGVVLLLGGIIAYVILNLIENAVDDTAHEEKPILMSESVVETVHAEDSNESDSYEGSEDSETPDNEREVPPPQTPDSEENDYSDMPGLVPVGNLTDEEDRIIGKKVNRFFSHTLNELLKIRDERIKRNKTE
jgi:hypothetical protein